MYSLLKNTGAAALVRMIMYAKCDTPSIRTPDRHRFVATDGQPYRRSGALEVKEPNIGCRTIDQQSDLRTVWGQMKCTIALRRKRYRFFYAISIHPDRRRDSHVCTGNVCQPAVCRERQLREQICLNPYVVENRNTRAGHRLRRKIEWNGHNATGSRIDDMARRHVVW